jgi:hypothetical protein
MKRGSLKVLKIFLVYITPLVLLCMYIHTYVVFLKSIKNVLEFCGRTQCSRMITFIGRYIYHILCRRTNIGSNLGHWLPCTLALSKTSVLLVKLTGFLLDYIKERKIFMSCFLAPKQHSTVKNGNQCAWQPGSKEISIT